MIKINEYSKKKKSVYDTNYTRIVAILRALCTKRLFSDFIFH